MGSGTPYTYGAHFGWLRDVSPADWIEPRMHLRPHDVGSIIPDGFEAYGRLFHPLEPDWRSNRRRERWSDLARRNGRIAHSQMQLHLINIPRGQPGPKGYERGDGPNWGSLPLEERRVLVELLRDETTTPDRCWFCMWEGYGGLDDGGVRERVVRPHREYLLYTGTIERALESPNAPFDQSPAMWWPDDRAWFVATEIDFAWTYIGGSRGLIDSLVSDSRLEVLPAELTDEITYYGDKLNEALNG
jgi:hypothetical protein